MSGSGATSRGAVYLVSDGRGPLLGELVARALTAAAALASHGHGRRVRVAVSHAAVADDPETAVWMRARTQELFRDAEVVDVRVPGEPDARPAAAAAAQASLAAADLIFLSGGDPVAGAKLLTASGADAWIRAAHARGAACLGVSAGSIMLGACWAEWPDPPTDAPFDGGALVRCADVLPGLVVDCHAEDDDWSELRLVQRMLAAEGRAASLRFLGIPTHGALVLHGDGREEIVGDPPVRLA